MCSNIIHWLASILWVGLTQSVEGLNKTKADLPRAGGNSASRQPLDFICNICSSWVSSLTAFRLKLQLFPESPACCLPHQILDLPSPHNHVIQFLKIILFLSIYIYILLVPFLWWTLPNTADHHSTHYTSIYPRGGGICEHLRLPLNVGISVKVSCSGQIH